MLLNAMQREIDGHTFLQRGLVESAITNIVAPAGRAKTYNKAIEYLLQGSSLLKGGSYKGLKKWQLTQKDEFDIRQAAAAFKILKRSNFYDMMGAIVDAEAKRSRR